MNRRTSLNVIHAAERLTGILLSKPNKTFVMKVVVRTITGASGMDELIVKNILQNTENVERLTRDELIHLIKIIRLMLGVEK